MRSSHPHIISRGRPRRRRWWELLVEGLRIAAALAPLLQLLLDECSRHRP